MRFAAAFVVFLTHTRGIVFVDYGSLEPQFKNVAIAAFMFIGRAGKEAVIVFFVISGFLVGGAAISRAWAGQFDWRRYSVDRVSRIATPLLPSIALAAFIHSVMNEQSSWGAIVGNAVGLQGVLVPVLPSNPPLWSLAYEVWFYVFAGALAALLVRRSLTASAILACSLAVYLELDIRLLGFWLIGAGAFFYRPRWPRIEIAIAAFLSTIGFLLSQLTRESGAFEALPVGHFTSLLILTVGVAWLLSGLRTAKCPPQLSSLGALAAAPSYSLYLTHYPVLMLFQFWGVKAAQPTFETWVTFVLLLAFVFALSLVFYWVFERNTPIVKRWLMRTVEGNNRLIST